MALVIALASPAAALAAPPANDAFGSAIALAPAASFSVDATNAEATGEIGEPVHAGVAGGASVWFSFVVAQTATVALSTCPVSFDALLAVYTGASVSGLLQVASSDNDPAIAGTCGAGASRVELLAAGGVTYWSRSTASRARPAPSRSPARPP